MLCDCMDYPFRRAARGPNKDPFMRSLAVLRITKPRVPSKWCLGSETGQEDTWPVSLVGYDAGVAAGVTTGRTTDSMVAPMRVAVTGESNGIS